jgi:transcriptional regulator with XRE-family HTH domain
MGPTASFIPGCIDSLVERGGLTLSDLASICNVREETVSRWKLGEADPLPKAQLVLSNLYDFVSRLRVFYAPAEIRMWLYARHPQLDGARAIDCVGQKKPEDVLRMLNRLEADAYI